MYGDCKQYLFESCCCYGIYQIQEGIAFCFELSSVFTFTGSEPCYNFTRHRASIGWSKLTHSQIIPNTSSQIPNTPSKKTKFEIPMTRYTIQNTKYTLTHLRNPSLGTISTATAVLLDDQTRTKLGQKFYTSLDWNISIREYIHTFHLTVMWQYWNLIWFKMNSEYSSGISSYWIRWYEEIKSFVSFAPVLNIIDFCIFFHLIWKMHFRKVGDGCNWLPYSTDIYLYHFVSKINMTTTKKTHKRNLLITQGLSLTLHLCKSRILHIWKSVREDKILYTVL